MIDSPVRYLVVSDIHANWEALEAVVADARGAYDRVVCCGDLVGYGADPNRVVDWAHSAVEAIVRGNHDKACTMPEELEWFNPAAQAATRWTIDTLTPENLAYIANLPRGPLRIDGFELVHGSPVDEDEYLLSRSNAATISDYLEAPVTFFGHTHVQGGFLFVRRGVKNIRPASEDEKSYTLELQPDIWYMLNPGSVGQPRDQDPRAAYAVYDTERRTVEFVRVPYDVEGAQQRILAAGLPILLARRLALGR